jgi:hypothetical protein
MNKSGIIPRGPACNNDIVFHLKMWNWGSKFKHTWYYSSLLFSAKSELGVQVQTRLVLLINTVFIQMCEQGFQVQTQLLLLINSSLLFSCASQRLRRL